MKSSNTLVQLPTAVELTCLKGRGPAFCEAVKELLGIDPPDPGRFVQTERNLVFWLDPETYLVEGSVDHTKAARLYPLDVTDQYKRILLIGRQSLFIASKLIMLDFFFNFPIGSATQARLGDAHVLIARTKEDEMFVQLRRSYFNYVVAQILNANRGLLSLEGID